MDPPPPSAGETAGRNTPSRPPSPALPSTPGAASTPARPNKLELDMSITPAVSALVHHLVAPLALHYTHQQVMGLRSHLTAAFTKAFAPTWNESNPHAGSGLRSLITDQIHGLPPILKEAAKAKGIDTAIWINAIAGTRKKKGDDADSDMWEVWCDPGMVVWRWGGWGWDEVEFDPIKGRREGYHVIWQASPTTNSPAAPETSPITQTATRSKAIPIRAPGLVNIAPSPSPAPSNASSAVAITAPRSPSPVVPAAAPSDESSGTSRPQTRYPFETRRPQSLSHSRTSSFARSVSEPVHVHGHKANESTSSNSSDSSDNGSHTQLLTPASRPGSADLFPDDKEEVRGRETSPSRNEPTVTPYDGGNVTVLGGGTKLGGSRPSSVMSTRTRSPSVSTITSRALGNAVGANSNGGGAIAAQRKPRTRRRIIPTHIGYFGQPGVGAPVMGAFGTPGVKPGQPGMPYWPQGQSGGGGGVGVGLAPPPVGNIGIANQMGMAHAMSKRIV